MCVGRKKHTGEGCLHVRLVTCSKAPHAHLRIHTHISGRDWIQVIGCARPPSLLQSCLLSCVRGFKPASTVQSPSLYKGMLGSPSFYLWVSFRYLLYEFRAGANPQGRLNCTRMAYVLRRKVASSNSYLHVQVIPNVHAATDNHGPGVKKAGRILPTIPYPTAFR